MKTAISFKNCQPNSRVSEFLENQIAQLRKVSNAHLNLKINIIRDSLGNFITKISILGPKAYFKSFRSKANGIFFSVSNAFQKTIRFILKRQDMDSSFQRRTMMEEIETSTHHEERKKDNDVVQLEELQENLADENSPPPAGSRRIHQVLSKKYLQKRRAENRAKKVVYA